MGMEVGVLTHCFKAKLEEVFAWLHQEGVKYAELGGHHVDEVIKMNPDEVKSLCKKYEITITALGRYPNNLHKNRMLRKIANKQTYEIIDAAGRLGVPCISTFVGYDDSLDYKGNMKKFYSVFKPIAEYAEKRNVKIAIENCPMKKEYHFGGGNLMITPEIFGEMFMNMPKNFGLNFDPSHLFWQSVDPAIVVEEFADRIFHTHAKDTLIDKERLKFAGVYGKAVYRYVIPGRGGINWKEYLSALKENGYSGVLSLEHEDGDYYGSEEMKKKGILEGKKYLEKILGEI